VIKFGQRDVFHPSWPERKQLPENAGVELLEDEKENNRTPV